MNNCDFEEAKQVALVEFRRRLKDKKLWNIYGGSSQYIRSGPFRACRYGPDYRMLEIITDEEWVPLPLSAEELSIFRKWSEEDIIEKDNAAKQKRCNAILKALKKPWWKFW